MSNSWGVHRGDVEVQFSLMLVYGYYFSYVPILVLMVNVCLNVGWLRCGLGVGLGAVFVVFSSGCLVLGGLVL